MIAKNAASKEKIETSRAAFPSCPAGFASLKISADTSAGNYVDPAEIFGSENFEESENEEEQAESLQNVVSQSAQPASTETVGRKRGKLSTKRTLDDQKEDSSNSDLTPKIKKLKRTKSNDSSQPRFVK